MNEEQKVYNGSVIWFSAKKGMGFISWAIDGVQQKDMFVHFSDLNMDGFKTVQKDQKVQFSIGTNFRGEPKAICVEVLKDQ